MVALDILMVIAEIAVALAGFSAVVANFSDTWTRAKSMLLGNLLAQSGITLFASLVPLITSQISGGGEEAMRSNWMVSSACYIFFASLSLIYMVVRQRLTHFKSVDIAFCLTFVLAIGAQIYNLYAGAEAWLYLMALLVNIAYAFISFTLLIRPAFTAEVQGDPH